MAFFNICFSDNISSESTSAEWSSSVLGREYRVNGMIMAVVLFIFLVIGAILNLTVIVSIVKKKLFSQPTFLLLLNLSVTDFLFCSTVMPFHVVTGFAGEFIFGSSDLVRCRVCNIGVTLVISSLLSLHGVALISVDRLLFIKRSLHYHKIVTFRRVLVTIFLTWIVCLAISLPATFFPGFRGMRYAHTLSHCLLNIHSYPAYIYLLIGEVLIPLSSLIISSLWVACIARKQLKLVYSSSLHFGLNSSHEFAALRQARKQKLKLQFHLFRVFGAIIVTNFLTWIPVLVFAAMGTFLNPDEIPLEYKIFSYLCFLFQPILHPVLEASLISDIEFPFLKGFRACKHRCKSGLHRREKMCCAWRCGFGMGFNGLRIGGLDEVCTCQLCGVLDMCSAAAMMRTELALEGETELV